MRFHTITSMCAAVLLGGATLLAASCASRPTSSAAPRSIPTPRAGDSYEGPPPAEDIRQVMTAKLAHTQAIVEGLALGDLEQVRANALRLEEVSQQSAWMVHDTITYVVLSDDFRRLARNMADNAANRDMNAVVADYSALTNSCVRCHQYLQREREAGQLPGRLSHLKWSAPGNSARMQ